MQDRPDLIQSELSGLAFDSLQCVFRPADIEVMYNQEPPEPVLNADIYLFVDPAAGGPQSDYAILSFQRQKGLVTVSIKDVAEWVNGVVAEKDKTEAKFSRTTIKSAKQIDGRRTDRFDKEGLYKY